MHAVPQVMPISSMRTNHTEVLEKLQYGPVILAQRSTPTAVLVSVEEWDKAAHELERLRRLELADQRSREMEEDPSLRIPFTKEELIKRGLIDG